MFSFVDRVFQVQPRHKATLVSREPEAGSPGAFLARRRPRGRPRTCWSDSGEADVDFSNNLDFTITVCIVSWDLWRRGVGGF